MRRWTRTAAAGGLEYTVEKVESKRQLRNDFFFYELNHYLRFLERIV
jgi:hypothetical protein